MAKRIYQGTPEWYAERRTGYGASDAPILVEGDEAAWRQLHAEKLGFLPPRAGNETMDLGKRLEDVIARVAVDRYGDRLRVVNAIVRHPELPHVFASLDRRRIGGDRRPTEIKKWGFKSDEWGPDGSDVVPPRILYQVQQQAAVTGADVVDVVVLFGGAKLERFHIGRDDTMVRQLLDLEVAAWAYVERGDMPPWPGPAPKRITLAVDEVPVDDTIRELVDTHEVLRAQAEAAERDLQAAKDRLREVLADTGGAKGLTADGRRLSISHRPQDPSPRTDWKLVAQAYRQWIEAKENGGPTPDPSLFLDATVSMFTTTTAGARPLRITIGKEPRNAA